MSESQSAALPRPAFTVTVSVGGCDWKRVMEQLSAEVQHVREHGPECRSAWGGAGTHGHVDIERRDVTEEQYNKELKEWFDAQPRDGGA